MSEVAHSHLTPLRVWHVVGPMNLGGAEVMVMELLRHKSPATQVDFLVHMRESDRGRRAAFDDEIEARGARLLPILTPVQSGIRKYLSAFAKHIRDTGKPDVIHIHLNARSGLVVLAARLNGIRRIIVHSHAALTFRGNLIYRIVAQVELQLSKLLFAGLATDFWGCSTEAIDSLFPHRLMQKQPRCVINNAIDVDTYLAVTDAMAAELRQKLMGAQEGVLIGNVGRIVRHKNAGFLVDVMARLAERSWRAVLVIVGREEDEAYTASIRRDIQAARLDGSIRFLGPRSNIAKLMAAFDVFASPALREGFGLVGAEAQAAGTPCVLSMGYPNSIDMGLDLVSFVEDFSPDGWADAIIASASRRRPRDAAVARAFAERGFSSRENTARIERAYREPGFMPDARNGA